MNSDFNKAIAHEIEQQIAKRDGKDVASTANLLQEISTALADLVSAVEDGAKPDGIAKAISAAVTAAVAGAMKSLQVNVASPQIRVPAANPTPVEVHNHVPQAAPPVVQIVPAKGWHIQFEFGASRDVPTGAKLTRLS